MRTNAPRLAAILGAALALAAGAATAQNPNNICFLIHDAKDTVVYRDWSPPFDGALDYASPGREDLRARDLHFSYFQTTVCQPVSMTATGAPKISSVDAIVASIPDSRPTPRGITTTTEPGGGFVTSNSGVVVVPEGGGYGAYGGYGGYGYGGYGTGVVDRARGAGAAVAGRAAARR